MLVKRRKIVITIMVDSCKLFTAYHTIIITVINMINSCAM